MVRSSIFCPVAAEWRCGQQAQKPVRAPRRVLMHVGVPTGGQRQPQVVRQPRAQHAHLAGAGDVNQIGLEALQHLADQRNVAQKRGIEAQVFFQGKGKKAARQLQGPHVAVFDDGLGAVSGADAEKGQIAPPRKGLEMAAGVRHPVHLVEGVGKVGHAGRSAS